MTATLNATQAQAVADNYGLCVSFVRGLGLPVHEHDDAVQDATLGLMRAVRRHDPARGALSTYAHHAMRTEVARGINRRSHGSVRSLSEPRPAALPIDSDGRVWVGPNDAYEVEATDDPEADTETRDRLRAAMVAMLSAARDPLDFDIVVTLFDGDGQGVAEDVARRHPVTASYVRKRLAHLRQAARDEVG